MPRILRLSIRLVVAAAFTATLARVALGQKPRSVEVSGIPALNFDADEGFGYGAIVALYGYDSGRTTYAWTLQPTVFLTTGGRRDYTAFFDMPSRDDRPWRVTGLVGHEQQLAAPYYGVGNATPYDASMERGSTRYYYRYGRTRDRVALDLQHPIGTPALRLLAGAGISRERINLTPFDSGTTLIQRDQPNSALSAQRTNYLRAGLTWDTRDREIGTHSGTWADAIVQRVDRSFGATTSYTRWTAAARRYQPLGDRVTFAERLLVQNTIGDAPFYALGEIETTQKPQDGLGGASSVRGLPKDRYVGKGILISNTELRWRAVDFKLAGRGSSLVLSAFGDAGRVWTDGVDVSTALQQLHAGYGAGARVSFGSSFVVAVDAAHSAQASAPIYIGLGYLF